MADIPSKPQVSTVAWINGQTRLNHNNLTAGVNTNLLNIKTAVDGIIDVLGEGVESALMKEVTYSELKALRDGGQLIPGQQYMITDYQCTTTTRGTSSAGHQFDIIVTADSTNELNEKARAALHSGDTYFANSKLESWQLWYCLDNDTTRFDWADSTNGKGVIYRMIDEFGNDVPYDFKNILFTKSGKYTNAYTFSYMENNVIKDASISGLNKNCYSNIMKKCIASSKQYLNFNVFYSAVNSFGCYGNVMGNNVYNNTFGNYSYNNVIGDDVYNNVIGSGFSYNIIGGNVYNNTIGSSASYNIIGSNVYNNTIGSYFAKNTIGSNFHSNNTGVYFAMNTVGNNVFNNTFGDTVESNTIGNYCRSNTIGGYFYNNTISNDFLGNIIGSSASADIYVRNCKFDDGVQYISLTSDDTSASPSNYLKNVHIHSGVMGTSISNRKTISVPDRNLPYSIDYYFDSNGNLVTLDDRIEQPLVHRTVFQYDASYLIHQAGGSELSGISGYLSVYDGGNSYVFSFYGSGSHSATTARTIVITIPINGPTFPVLPMAMPAGQKLAVSANASSNGLWGLASATIAFNSNANTINSIDLSINIRAASASGGSYYGGFFTLPKFIAIP